MITKKIIWKDDEIIIFDRGLSEDGVPMFRFYRKSQIPSDITFNVIEDPSDDILRTIAMSSGDKVTKRYYVTPPDYLEDWMGTYVYLPSGYIIHCDPIDYGNEDAGNDVSQNAADFVLKHKDKLFNTRI